MTEAEIILIYARSRNHVIGRNGRVPWQLPDEYAFFDATTRGFPIIMGRKTYEDHLSALAQRLNIVISTRPDYSVADGVVLKPSLATAIQEATADSDKVFVIGGAGVFEQALPFASCAIETVVDAHIDGDVMLPEFDFSAWDTRLLSQHGIDDNHQYAFSIFEHRRVISCPST